LGDDACWGEQAEPPDEELAIKAIRENSPIAQTGHVGHFSAKEATRSTGWQRRGCHRPSVIAPLRGPGWGGGNDRGGAARAESR
jgi:hypothetical protein